MHGYVYNSNRNNYHESKIIIIVISKMARLQLFLWLWLLLSLILLCRLSKCETNEKKNDFTCVFFSAHTFANKPAGTTKLDIISIRSAVKTYGRTAGKQLGKLLTCDASDNVLISFRKERRRIFFSFYFVC